jgi:hypothetical protein
MERRQWGQKINRTKGTKRGKTSSFVSNGNGKGNRGIRGTHGIFNCG